MPSFNVIREKGRGSALFPTDSWVDHEGATENVRKKELACKFDLNYVMC
jgi:hypothetical protein